MLNISRAKQNCALHKGKWFYMMPEFVARIIISHLTAARNKESTVPISITLIVNFVRTPLSGESYFQPIAPSAFPLVLFFPVTRNLYLIAVRARTIGIFTVRLIFSTAVIRILSRKSVADVNIKKHTRYILSCN